VSSHCECSDVTVRVSVSSRMCTCVCVCVCVGVVNVGRRLAKKTGRAMYIANQRKFTESDYVLSLCVC
jgi:hypothetical protein